MVIVVMGVSGCGKTTTGKLLAATLSVPFYDADDFHPAKNVEKMRLGQPLDDDDRKPWLLHLSEMIKKWNRTAGAVLACSALKQDYRSVLMANSNPEDVLFVYLKGSKKLISDRLEKRSGHYMPPELLDSQFSDLEEPANALHVPINQSPEKIVSEILNRLNLTL